MKYILLITLIFAPCLATEDQPYPRYELVRRYPHTGILFIALYKRLKTEEDTTIHDVYKRCKKIPDFFTEERNFVKYYKIVYSKDKKLLSRL